MNIQHIINIDQNVKPIDPDSVTQLRLRDGTYMPQAAMGTFHSDNRSHAGPIKDIYFYPISLPPGRWCHVHLQFPQRSPQ